MVQNIGYPAEYDETGAEINPAMTFKGIDYSKFIPILIADAKNTHELVDSLEEENEVQDSIIDAQADAIAELQDQMAEIYGCLEGILPWLCGMSSSAIEILDEGTQEDLENTASVTLSDNDNIVLDQNVPNPFAERTVITYTIPAAVKQAQILFYNSAGVMIKTVDVQTRGQGQLNVYGSDLSSGIYSYTLVADGNVVSTKKMLKLDY